MPKETAREFFFFHALQCCFSLPVCVSIRVHFKQHYQRKIEIINFRVRILACFCNIFQFILLPMGFKSPTVLFRNCLLCPHKVLLFQTLAFTSAYENDINIHRCIHLHYCTSFIKGGHKWFCRGK